MYSAMPYKINKGQNPIVTISLVNCKHAFYFYFFQYHSLCASFKAICLRFSNSIMKMLKIYRAKLIKYVKEVLSKIHAVQLQPLRPLFILKRAIA